MSNNIVSSGDSIRISTFPKVLVFGASGQLGQCLKKVVADRHIENVVFPPEEQADILNMDLLEHLFADEMPDYVINCAAYTAVDKAEDEVELARKINRDGAANLAKACQPRHATLIQVSTDFVFSGNQPKLLKEDDLAAPLSIYGLTKLQGEVAIQSSHFKHFILRTSWLYSEFANNFVKTMRRLGKERDSISVVADQVGNPTYAMDLAGAIFTIINSGSTEYGVYHFSNEGLTSWFDFTKAIIELSGLTTTVKPITTEEYPTKAQRPAFSAMDKSKFKGTFDFEIPYWRDSLKRCIAELDKQQ